MGHPRQEDDRPRRRAEDGADLTQSHPSLRRLLRCLRVPRIPRALLPQPAAAQGGARVRHVQAPRCGGAGAEAHNPRGTQAQDAPRVGLGARAHLCLLAVPRVLGHDLLLQDDVHLLQLARRDAAAAALPRRHRHLRLHRPHDVPHTRRARTRGLPHRGRARRAARQELLPQHGRGRGRQRRLQQHLQPGVPLVPLVGDRGGHRVGLLGLVCRGVCALLHSQARGPRAAAEAHRRELPQERLGARLRRPEHGTDESGALHPLTAGDHHRQVLHPLRRARLADECHLRPARPGLLLDACRPRAHHRLHHARHAPRRLHD
mmetsp:Transcript_36893/g.88580  ORF Transcript_36893/g.88580 Transcript_36893/m.88580 type:complete len:318 (+) Transcript_36893:1007-1960(+)